MASTPPTNEAFLREVDEELRRDQMAGIWRRWGRWLVVAVIVALAAFAAYLWFESRRDTKAGVEGEQLSQLLDDLAGGKSVANDSRLKTLAASKVDGYRAAAQLTSGAMAVQNNNLKEASRIYGALAADMRLEQPVRDLALIRQTVAEYDTLSPPQVVARLRPLAISGSPWFGAAGEMTAIAYLRMNRPELAGAMFGAIAQDETVPETIRSRVNQLAGTLGVDALPARGKDGK